MDQYIGKMLENRYEILECIGIGGMAMVYKSRDHRLNRLVAIKILKPELASDAEFRRRFHDESQAVAMLSHVNIVAIYDVSRSDELDYIVMELVDGMTLKQYMKKRGTPLSWREALHFITQIVRALGHAHSRGIIHRDIKPQNIMVLRDGSVKVTDFGIARVASAAQATLTQEALGSVHYISPEQARGSHIDGRSDLYSAGVVLYEMLTGRLPFEGETPVSVAIQHINSIPIPPRDLNPDIPSALEAITLKAMSPKAENRYASADEMLADLDEFRKNPDVTPEHARQDDDALMEEPTRVVPVSEIRQEESQQRVRRTQPEANRDRDRIPEQQARRSPRVERPAARDGYDDYDEEPRRRGVPPFLIAILAILVFVGGLIFFAYNFFLKGMFEPQDAQLRVPDLTPYNYSELKENTSLYEGFTIEVVEERSTGDYAAGTVLDQDPKADTLIQDGDSTVIKLVIAVGEEPIPMPNVVGQLGVNANSNLMDLGLIPQLEYEYSDDVDSDLVIRTIPEAGEELYEGDTVIVIISQGKKAEQVTVPNFLNMPVEELEEAVNAAGLTMGSVQPFPSSDYDKDRISYQSIVGGKEVDRGTTINFWVSTGSGEEEPSPSPSESLPPTPSGDPNASPDPGPSDTMAVVTNKTIPIDLSQFDGDKVDLRVEVGGKVVFSGNVDTSIGNKDILVSGTGRQLVEIYDGNTLVGSYYLDFSA